MSKGKIKRKRRMRILLILGGVILGIAAVFVLLMTTVFIIRQSDIEGCVNSNANEVNEAVYRNDYCRNSLYLYFSNQREPVEGIPFVSSVEVKLVSPWHVKILVKEDEAVAYVYDSSNNMYFYTDKEMNIIERSSKKIDGLIEIKGVSAAANAQADASGDALQTEPSTSRSYLTLAYQYIQQYELSAESLEVESSGAITMQSGSITVKLGLNVNTAEKFKRLNAILPLLKGRSGTLDLTSWSSAGDDIVFIPDTSASGDALEVQNTE
jgi:cell division septal protein FtsQ